MDNNTNNNTENNMGFFSFIWAGVILGKIFNMVSWSWWIVMSPAIVLTILVIIIAVMMAVTKEKGNETNKG